MRLAGWGISYGVAQRVEESGRDLETDPSTPGVGTPPRACAAPVAPVPAPIDRMPCVEAEARAEAGAGARERPQPPRPRLSVGLAGRPGALIQR